MRITGGLARGIPLTLPPGDAVRPATDAMRQAVFSSLAARVPGARFLDLFAGSGAYGLEALSRGAAAGLFVERNPRAVDCVRRNLAAVCKSLGRSGEGVEVRPGDALAIKPEGGPAPDLVFVDPPYEMITEIAPRLFARLGEIVDVRADPLVVFEMPGGVNLAPDGWTLVKRLGKGERQPTVAIFRPSPAAPSPG